MPGVNGRLGRLAAALRGADPEGPGAAALSATIAAAEQEPKKQANFNHENQQKKMFGNAEAADGNFFTSPDQGKVDGPCA